MSCGTQDCGCGCEDLLQPGSKKSLPIVQEAEDCGDGSCGCGCADVSDQEGK